jgi:hypothetical protein
MGDPKAEKKMLKIQAEQRKKRKCETQAEKNAIVTISRKKTFSKNVQQPFFNAFCCYGDAVAQLF